MKDYVVFTIGGNKQTAKDFAKFWNCQLGKIIITKFADGEEMVKVITNVKDKDVIVIESLNKKPNDRLIKILQLLDCISRSHPRSVTLIVPYLAYSRQEKINEINEPLSCEVAAKVLETGKYDRLMTIDLHNVVIESYFTRGVKNISTGEMFANYYANYLKDKGYDYRDVVIVSPDKGSNYRADELVFRFRGARKIICEKKRTEKDKVDKITINGDVEGKICIIIDDIISTGHTIAETAKALYKAKAKEVVVAATHGVFSSNAVEVMKKARVKDIVVTNTIEQKVEGVNVLDIFQLLIQNI